MLCLSGFELYYRWVPLREVKNHTLFPSRPYKGVPYPAMMVVSARN